MLENLLSTQRAQFDALAKAWLSSGATAVSIWGQEGLVDHWPSDSTPPPTDFTEPIRLGNQTIGEIRVAGYTNGTVHQQLAFTTMLMSHLTQLSFELELARRVQSGLLPTSTPLMPGVQIYAKSRAAKQMSGDFHDFIQQETDQLVFAVGDVVDKGVSAALLTTVMRKVIRTAVKVNTAPSPKSILAYAIADMYEELDRAALFVSTFIGQYDRRSRSLAYVNAGQSPVIYRPAQRKAHLLPADTTPVGVVPHGVFADSVLRLAPDDLLIVATDGLSEAIGCAGKIFGHEALLALVDAHAHCSASEIGEMIFDAITRFTATTLRDDDQTLLVIKGVPISE
jgi:phosphoserine phosphatase RsbU/P